MELICIHAYKHEAYNRDRRAKTMTDHHPPNVYQFHLLHISGQQPANGKRTESTKRTIVIILLIILLSGFILQFLLFCDGLSK